jgi:hypothetical protein
MEMTKAQRGRIAIRSFKVMADALALRGFYRPSGKSGQTLRKALKTLSPEIYGTMNDPRCIEIKGLEYVLDRLPRGIESCTRLVLTAQEDFQQTAFEEIIPPKRRRISYRMGAREICFIVTRGLSEIYDILTHLTFLDNEAEKIHRQIHDENGDMTPEWKQLDRLVKSGLEPDGSQLDQALWNISIILGRTYQETRQLWTYLESGRRQWNSNNGLFGVIHSLGNRVQFETQDRENRLSVYFTPSLRDMIGQHKYSEVWARAVKEKLLELGFGSRALHIISANLHSVMKLLYGYAALPPEPAENARGSALDFFHKIREATQPVRAFALEHGMTELKDLSGAQIDCQVIDTAGLKSLRLHPGIGIDSAAFTENMPVLLVIDYAFGTQAFEIMDELLEPIEGASNGPSFDIRSISVMGKAGILTGKKGDIMLATSHVMEGTPHNYIVDNDLKQADFDASVQVYTGPIVTVLGTSLQNRDVLEKFQTTSWKAVGLEMEGGHYHRAINAAIIRGHIDSNIKVRYAYYASDNPLVSGQTLASGSMGEEGIRPTYLITQVIMKKILAPGHSPMVVSESKRR